MTVDRDLRAFCEYNVEDSDASLWVFKKRPFSEQNAPFTAVSVLMSPNLEAEMKALVVGYQNSHTMAEPYSLLAQPSEGGFLSVPSSETLFSKLIGIIDQPVEDNLVKNEKQLNNAAGYVFRLRHEDRTLYCIKRTTSDWTTRKKRGYMNSFFKQATLDINDSPSFSISRQFDFIVTGDHLFMTVKAAFESLMNHRVSYEESYALLKQEAGFVSAFSDIAVMDAFVGKNATHLRRMSVIRLRGYYKNPEYLTRLKTVSESRGWGIQFDDQGRIVPTEETMRSILHILLDHRLRSELSENQYDVPSTWPVA